MDLQVLKIHCNNKSFFKDSFLSFSRTCKRVDQEELSKEEMVEIEEDLNRRRELLERKCQQLGQSLPKPKKDVSHLRLPKMICKSCQLDLFLS